MCTIKLNIGFVQKVISCLEQSKHQYSKTAIKQLDDLVLKATNKVKNKHGTHKPMGHTDVIAKHEQWSQDELENITNGTSNI